MRICQNQEKKEYSMEPISADALPAQSREERMNHRLMEIDRRIEGLAQEAHLIEQSLDEIRKSTDKTIPKVLGAIRTRHFLPSGFATSSEAEKFLEHVLKFNKVEQNKLSVERTKVAPFADLPGDLFDVVFEQADLKTKSTAAHVSKEWGARAVRDAQRECSEFITGELDTYLTLLSRPEITSSQKERVIAELQALKNVLFPEKYDFKTLKRRLIEIRDNIVQSFGQLSQEDLQKMEPYFMAVKDSKVPFIQKQFKLIPALLNKVPDYMPDYVPDFLACVTDFLNHGAIDTAQEIAARIPDDSRATANVWIALKMAEVGNIQGALDIIGPISPCIAKSDTLTFIAFKLAQRGDFQRAHLVRESIRDPAFQKVVDFLISGRPLSKFKHSSAAEFEINILRLVGQLEHVGAVDDAIFLFRLGVGMPINISMFWSDIINSMARQGNFKRALDLLENIHDVRERQNLRSSIGSRMAEKGDIEGALKIYDELKVAGGGDNRDSLLRDVVVSFLKKGDMEQALKTAKKISSSSPEKLYMDSVLPVFELARRGDFKTATDMAAHTGLPFFDDVFDIIDSEKVRQMYLG